MTEKNIGIAAPLPLTSSLQLSTLLLLDSEYFFTLETPFFQSTYHFIYYQQSEKNCEYAATLPMIAKTGYPLIFWIQQCLFALKT